MGHQRWRITFTDGSVRDVDGYGLAWDDSVLRIRTTDRGYGGDEFVSFPLAAVRSWEPGR